MRLLFFCRSKPHVNALDGHPASATQNSKDVEPSRVAIPEMVLLHIGEQSHQGEERRAGVPIGTGQKSIVSQLRQLMKRSGVLHGAEPVSGRLYPKASLQIYFGQHERS